MKISDFKVGDIVQLRSDLVVDNSYDGFTFMEGMRKLENKILVVDEVRKTSVHFKDYLWFIPPAMIAHKLKYCVGDKVKHKNFYDEIAVVNGYISPTIVSITFNKPANGSDYRFIDYYTKESIKPKAEYSWSATLDFLTLVEPEKLKVGDTVRVRKDLKCRNEYGGLYFAEEMEEYRGKEFTLLRKTVGDGWSLNGIINWVFNDAMLEKVDKVKEEEKVMLKVGDRVVVNGKVDSETFDNAAGTIRCFFKGDSYDPTSNSPYIGVEFDKPLRYGHNLNSTITLSKEKHGYYVKNINIKKESDVMLTKVNVGDLVRTAVEIEVGDLFMKAGREGTVKEMCNFGCHAYVDFGGLIGTKKIHVRNLMMVKPLDPFESVKDIDYIETEKLTEFDSRLIYDEDGKIKDGKVKLVERDWTFIFKKNKITAKMVVDGVTYTGIAIWDGTNKYLRGRGKELATAKARRAYFDAAIKEIISRD